MEELIAARQEAAMPTRLTKHCIEKLEKGHNKYGLC